MRAILAVILCLALGGCGLFGCARKTVKPVQAPEEFTELCKKAEGVCWGKAGDNPADIPECSLVYRCYDWEIRWR